MKLWKSKDRSWWQMNNTHVHIWSRKEVKMVQKMIRNSTFWKEDAQSVPNTTQGHGRFTLARFNLSVPLTKKVNKNQIRC